MNRIVINQNTSSQLDALSQPVELRDETGKLLGHFIPTSSLAASASCPYSEDGLTAMRSESDGRTLNEIWNSLTEP